MSAPRVPTTVTLDQVRVAVAVLGIDFTDLDELVLDGRRGSAAHVRRDPKGHLVAAGNEVAMTASSFEIRDSTRAEKRGAARARIRRARWTR